MPVKPMAGRRSATVVTALAAAMVAMVAPGFLAVRQSDTILPGPGVTRLVQLSAYLPELAGTPGDTPVFELGGSAAGGTVLVLGGTHADEIAGYLAAVVLVERARVRGGRLLVIPRANASGFTHTVPMEGHPSRVHLRTLAGTTRTFTVGGRATNPVHQWPDPQVHVLPDSGQVLSGMETRNLNRAYPGRRNGTLTEQVACAITSLITREAVDLAIDLHEAAPEYPVVNTIVAHERALDLAALVSMNMDMEGLSIGLEPSPPKLRGLSHREWGDSTQALAVLMETANPGQGRLRGRTDEALMLEGRDRFYRLAGARGRLTVPFSDQGWPVEARVARHLAGIGQFLDALGEVRPGRGVRVEGIPQYGELTSRGLGAFLNSGAEQAGGGVAYAGTVE